MHWSGLRVRYPQMWNPESQKTDTYTAYWTGGNISHSDSLLWNTVKSWWFRFTHTFASNMRHLSCLFWSGSFGFESVQWGLKEKETENWIYKQLSTEGLIVLFPWFSACTRPTAGAKALAHNCRAEARQPKPAEASPRFHLWAGHGSSVHISKMFCHIFISLTKTLQCYSR